MNQEVRDIMNEYISAVTRRLPKHMRPEVSRELESVIADMLEERCGSVAPDKRDARVVLAELGEPLELAVKYNPNKSALISGSYYYIYLLVLKTVLICAAFGITLASVLEVFSNGFELFDTILVWLWNLSQGFWISFGVVTFIFAVLERAMDAHNSRGGK